MTSKEQPPERGTRRRPTIRDIAAEAGVSKGLVSLILNGNPGPSAETTARVLAIADRLGYRTDRTASLLARRRSRMLGITVTPSNPFHAELVEEIQRIADQRGYELGLGAVTPSHDERQAIETLLDFRCEALFLLGSVLPAKELAELTAGVPVVSIGRSIDMPGFDVVRTAEDVGMALLVDHLVELGHRRITHVDGGDGFVSAERRHAYVSAIRRHGLSPAILPGGETERDGILAAETLDLSGGVTAVVAYNDRCAVGVLDHFDRARINVPKRVSVTGYDNSLLAQLHRMNLTTVSQAPKEQARLAVAAAIERLDGDRTQDQEFVLEPHLVVRRSTAKVPSP
ncbi:LacI family DNA-binding transcriptional regulator [Acrocarpospora macrocephala]|uniref:LacI family transcriptional regulator n=1 Tax=Acrocarpospora macrocephala TaxID=150177 RepID=A0A5M3X0D4_9ACTN|nr:LacI family DNA-binding transcriptional regulator [Acrocarpospora macrocephala]GES11738.1 LacI family transcriptional regulator [Acrocarpospora macrocephala]